MNLERNGIGNWSIALVAGLLLACTERVSGLESEAESESEAEAEAEGESEGEAEGEVKVDCTGADDCMCEDACARNENCDVQDYDTCVDDCPCFEAIARPEIVSAFNDCQALSKCGSDADCLAAALAEVGATPTFEAYASACETRAAECEKDFGGLCSEGFAVAKDEIIEDLQACLESDCEDIQLCAGIAIFAATPPGCGGD